MNGKYFRILGIIASCTAVMMYVSYIPQIIGNLSTTTRGDYIQPIAAAVNCTLWVVYGLLKKPQRDIPIVIANSPGIVFGLAAAITALR